MSAGRVIVVPDEYEDMVRDEARHGAIMIRVLFVAFLLFAAIVVAGVIWL